MENLRKRLNGKAKGFTLVELLVVIAIIAILSVTAYVALGGQTAKARNSRRMQDLGAIQNALEIYFVENYSRYPDNTAALVTKKYMPEVPVDPVPASGGGAIPYVYAVDGANHKTYQLATIIENEDGGYTSYVIGNGTGLLPQGKTSPACTIDCDVVDAGGTNCVPYCL